MTHPTPNIFLKSFNINIMSRNNIKMNKEKTAWREIQSPKWDFKNMKMSQKGKVLSVEGMKTKYNTNRVATLVCL